MTPCVASWRWGRTTAHAPYAQNGDYGKTPVELSVSLFDSLAEIICSKESSSVGYRVDWCINHRLESNQFVGRRDEEGDIITSRNFSASRLHNVT